MEPCRPGSNLKSALIRDAGNRGGYKLPSETGDNSRDFPVGEMEFRPPGFEFGMCPSLACVEFYSVRECRITLPSRISIVPIS